LPDDGVKGQCLAQRVRWCDGIVIVFFGAAMVASLLEIYGRNGIAGCSNRLQQGRAGDRRAGVCLGKYGENKKAEQDESSSHIQADSSGTVEYNTLT